MKRLANVLLDPVLGTVAISLINRITQDSPAFLPDPGRDSTIICDLSIVAETEAALECEELILETILFFGVPATGRQVDEAAQRLGIGIIRDLHTDQEGREVFSEIGAEDADFVLAAFNSVFFLPAFEFSSACCAWSQT